jgi:hypothetical protein
MRTLWQYEEHELTDGMRRLREILKSPPQARGGCIHRGKARLDIPHSGPCCVPFECIHENTPEIVNRKLCLHCKYREGAACLENKHQAES